MYIYICICASDQLIHWNISSCICIHYRTLWASSFLLILCLQKGLLLSFEIKWNTSSSEELLQFLNVGRSDYSSNLNNLSVMCKHWASLPMLEPLHGTGGDTTRSHTGQGSSAELHQGQQPLHILWTEDPLPSGHRGRAYWGLWTATL